MQEDRIWKLVARRLAGEATVEDLRELNDCLPDNSEIYYQVEVIFTFCNHITPAEQFDQAMLEKLLRKITGET